MSARTELVVVGGGVVGLAMAWQAARADPERMAVVRPPHYAFPNPGLG